MKVEFKNQVTFSTLHRAFTGAGIPPIPEDATHIKVGDHTVAYIGPSGDAWECFIGNGTSETSQTYYWPDIGMCPRAWAQET